MGNTISPKELFTYWIVMIIIVISLGAGVGKMGQAKLESTPTMLLMDHATKTQIMDKLDRYELRIDNLDSRLTTLETRVDKVVGSN